MAAVNEAIQERRRQALLAEDLRPLGKGQVGGDRDAGALIAVRTVSSIMRGTLLLTANSTNSVQGAVWSQQ